ncbi:MAG TPA: TlpA disulfide reductase family protein [Anaerolineales bacterium]|nr:TlpA disulfide reductase family protein [Anaerolineales bacterium]
MKSKAFQLMAMGLIGAGLLVLGMLAMIMLPKPEASAGSTGESPAIPARVEFYAPALVLHDLDGRSVSLSDYPGQVVLVNNWATWCPPCKEEMPALQAFYEDHQHQDFTIIAIEAGEPVAEVAQFVAAYGLTFPVWPDPDQQAAAAFHNPALPNSYVIDKNGTVRLVWMGGVDQATLEKYVTPILEE